MIRYQSYFLYSPEFETYMSDTDHNDINHTAEGYFLYNFTGGLSLELLDKYATGHDDILENIDNINYASNYLYGSAAYEATEKIRLRMDYSIYTVDYESLANIKDRVDNSLATFIFFKIRPKTSLFFQYINTNVNYDNSSTIQSADSTENSYLAGIRWNVTSKTSGTFKAGYQDKKYDRSDLGDRSIFKMELDGSYEISGRSSMTVMAKNELTETDEVDAFYIRANSLETVYEYAVTERITGYMGLFYEQEDYGNLDRKDTTFDISPSLSYIYNDWLSLNAAYTYENLNSSGSDQGEDYSQNSILLSASASF
jgi:polysaccharide biosynthesis protein VpsM